MEPNETYQDIAICYHGKMVYTGRHYVDKTTRLPRLSTQDAVILWTGAVGQCLTNGGRVFFVADVKGTLVYDIKDKDDPSRPIGDDLIKEVMSKPEPEPHEEGD